MCIVGWVNLNCARPSSSVRAEKVLLFSFSECFSLVLYCAEIILDAIMSQFIHNSMQIVSHYLIYIKRYTIFNSVGKFRTRGGAGVGGQEAHS